MDRVEKSTNFRFDMTYDLLPDYPRCSFKMLNNPVAPPADRPLLSSLFMSELKPLLVAADLGLGVDELVIRSAEYNQQGGELHPDDQRILD
jgi:hypothetical protein